jgi:hypothetical protein
VLHSMKCNLYPMQLVCLPIVMIALTQVHPCIGRMSQVYSVHCDSGKSVSRPFKSISCPIFAYLKIMTPNPHNTKILQASNAAIPPQPPPPTHTHTQVHPCIGSLSRVSIINLCLHSHLHWFVRPHINPKPTPFL